MIITVTHTKARTTTAWFNKTWAAAAISGHAENVLWQCCSAALWHILFCFWVFFSPWQPVVTSAWWEQGFEQHHPLTGTPIGHRLSRCPGKLWMPTLWKGPWATWSDRRSPCLWQGSSTRWSLKSLPKLVCDSMWVCLSGAMKWSICVTALVQCCPHHLLRSNPVPI